MEISFYNMFTTTWRRESCREIVQEAEDDSVKRGLQLWTVVGNSFLLTNEWRIVNILEKRTCCREDSYSFQESRCGCKSDDKDTVAWLKRERVVQKGKEEMLEYLNQRTKDLSRKTNILWVIGRVDDVACSCQDGEDGESKRYSYEYRYV